MDVSAHVSKMLDGLKRTLKLSMKYGDPEDLNQNLDEILKMAMETCQIDMLNIASNRAIEIATNSNSEHEFDTVFEENSQTDCSASAVKLYGIYKEFEQYVRDSITKAGSGASSIQTVTQTTKVSNDMDITETNQAIDPITKGPLVRPVRNRICNHIYGYQSVMDSLSINRRLRCPMIGCSNKDYIVLDHLIEIDN